MFSAQIPGTAPSQLLCRKLTPSQPSPALGAVTCKWNWKCRQLQNFELTGTPVVQWDSSLSPWKGHGSRESFLMAAERQMLDPFSKTAGRRIWGPAAAHLYLNSWENYRAKPPRNHFPGFSIPWRGPKDLEQPVWTPKGKQCLTAFWESWQCMCCTWWLQWDLWHSPVAPL